MATSTGEIICELDVKWVHEGLMSIPTSCQRSYDSDKNAGTENNKYFKY